MQKKDKVMKINERSVIIATIKAIKERKLVVRNNPLISNDIKEKLGELNRILLEGDMLYNDSFIEEAKKIEKEILRRIK